MAFVFGLWAIIQKTMDWVGRSTLLDDWRQLVHEKLPWLANWLLYTPWWVPAGLATILTAWIVWPARLSWAKSADSRAPSPVDAKRVQSAPVPPSVRHLDGADHDIVGADKPLRLRIKETSDYTDVSIDLVFKNRSQHTLWLRGIGSHLSIDGKMPPKSGGSVTRPFLSGQVQVSPMGTVRLYNGARGKAGAVRFNVLFGLSEKTARTIVYFSYDFIVTHKVLDEIGNSAFTIDIVRDNTAYEITESEAQKHQ